MTDPQQEINLESLADGLTESQIKALRKAATKRMMKLKRKKREKIEIYFQPAINRELSSVIQWAYEKKLIKHPTKWSFCKMAVVNAVIMIKEQIKEESLNTAATETKAPYQQTRVRESHTTTLTAPPDTEVPRMPPELR